MLGKDATPVLVEVAGHDYLKAKVDEQFSIRDG